MKPDYIVVPILYAICLACHDLVDAIIEAVIGIGF